MIKMENIFTDVEVTSYQELFDYLDQAMATLINTEPQSVATALHERESESTTAFVSGVAIPHGKVDIKTPIVNIIKFKNPISSWESLDGAPVEIAINILVPINGAQEHLKILSTLSRKLVDDEFIQDIKQVTKTDEYLAKFEFLND